MNLQISTDISGNPTIGKKQRINVANAQSTRTHKKHANGNSPTSVKSYTNVIFERLP